MPFTPITPREFTKIKRLEFIELTPGPHIIRVLDPDYVMGETHYINRVSIACLGDDCPVCRNNRRIVAENPKTYKDIKGYYPNTIRYAVNVLDRTPAKICPKCGYEVKQLSLPICPKCNEMITDVTPAPLEKVKVLAKGVTLFKQLEAIEKAILDAEASVLGLTNFDLILIVSGSGKETVITPIYSGKVGNPVPEGIMENRFDLSKVLIKLTAEEMIDFQKGVSLSDLFKGRSLSEEEKKVSTETGKNVAVFESPVTAVADMEEVRRKVMELFAQHEVGTGK